MLEHCPVEMEPLVTQILYVPPAEKAGPDSSTFSTGAFNIVRMLEHFPVELRHLIFISS